jgi:hypothetical protein
MEKWKQTLKEKNVQIKLSYKKDKLFQLSLVVSLYSFCLF